MDGGDLPWPDEHWELLTWFYGLSGDEDDVDLRGRYRDGDRLAQNLMTAFERATYYAKKVGRSPGAGTDREKNRGPSLSCPPVDWRAIGARMYPDMELPADWMNLPAHARQAIVDDAVLGKKESGVAA